MFIFNLKVNKNLFSRFLFILMLLVIIGIFIFTVYLIFIKDSSQRAIAKSTIKGDEIFELNEKNYTTILKAANENIDSYIGLKVHVQGYVYRLLNFEKNQFVVARDMLISNDNQYVIVGFLSEYENAMDFADGTWVDVVGEIKKGDFAGPIAILDVLSIKQIDALQNPFVSMPDDTYIPTANMF